MPPTPIPNPSSRFGKRRNVDGEEDASVPKKTKTVQVKPAKLPNPAIIRVRQMTLREAPQISALRHQPITSKSSNSGPSAANPSNKGTAAGENVLLAKKAGTPTQLQSISATTTTEEPLGLPIWRGPINPGTWIEYATAISKFRIKSSEIGTKIAVSFVDSLFHSAKAKSPLKHTSPEETAARGLYRALSHEERKLVYEDADFERQAVILDTSEDLIKAEITEHKRPCTIDIEAISYDQLQPAEPFGLELDGIAEDMYALRKEYREWCDNNGKLSRKLLMRPILRIDEFETRDRMREVRKDLKQARRGTEVSNVNDMFSTSGMSSSTNPAQSKAPSSRGPETSDRQLVGALKKKKRMRISDPIDIFEDQTESGMTQYNSQSKKGKAPINSLGAKCGSRVAELDDSDPSEDSILPRKTKRTKIDDRSNLEKAQRRVASTTAPPAPRQKIAPKSRSALKETELPLVEPETLEQLSPKTLKIARPQTKLVESAPVVLVKRMVRRTTLKRVNGSGFLTSLIGSIGQAHPINNAKPSKVYPRAGLNDNGSDESGKTAMTSSVQPNYRLL